MNDDKEKQDDKMETYPEYSIYMEFTKTPVEELKLGVDDNTSTLTTQETSVKSLVYITNIQEGKPGIMKVTRNNGKNLSEQDNRKSTAKISPLEKFIFINSNDNLKDYGESGRDNNPGRDKEWKKKDKNTKKLYIWNSIWMSTWKNN